MPVWGSDPEEVSFFKVKLQHHLGYVAFLTRGYALSWDLPVDYFKAPPKRWH